MLNQTASENRNTASLLPNNSKGNASSSKGPRAPRDCTVRDRPARALRCGAEAAGLPAQAAPAVGTAARGLRASRGPLHTHTHPTTTILNLRAASSELPQRVRCHTANPHGEATDLGGHRQLRGLGRAPQKEGNPLNPLHCQQEE